MPRGSVRPWWEIQLAGGLVCLVVSLIVGEWVIAGVAAFIALYAGAVIAIKQRRSRGAPW